MASQEQEQQQQQQQQQAHYERLRGSCDPHSRSHQDSEKSTIERFLPFIIENIENTNKDLITVSIPHLRDYFAEIMKKEKATSVEKEKETTTSQSCSLSTTWETARDAARTAYYKFPSHISADMQTKWHTYWWIQDLVSDLKFSLPMNQLQDEQKEVVLEYLRLHMQKDQRMGDDLPPALIAMFENRQLQK